MRKYAFFLAALLAVACVEDNLDTTIPVDDSSVFTLTASAPEAAVDTKTQISDELEVTWSAEDQIKVCFPVNFSLYNNSGSQVTGASAIFTTSAEDGASRAVFSCDSWDVDLTEQTNNTNKYNDVGYAFYPSSVEFSHTVASNQNGNSGTMTCTYTIPSVQNAVEGSFDKNLNPAYAPVERGELLAGTSTVAFRNIAALVRISLSDKIDNVKEIRISSTNASMGTVCGKVTLNISKDNATPNIATRFDGFDSTPVVLRKADNTNLQAGQTYYAVIAPGPAHKGLKLTFVDENTAEVEKTISLNWSVIASDCWTINVNNPIEFPEAIILGVDTENFEPSAAGESKTVNVTAGDSWTVSSNSDWLTVSTTGGSGNGSFTMTAAENKSFSARETTVTVASGDKEKTIRVYQKNMVYHIVEQITRAEQMEDGGTYIINFKDATSYYWRTDASGNTARVYVYYPSQGFTADYVYRFEALDGYLTESKYGYYESASIGLLKSVYTDRYLNHWDAKFTVVTEDETSPGYYVPLYICSNYAGATTNDIDFYSHWGYFMGCYQADRNFYWTENTSGYDYKWYVHKVELR